MVVMTKIDALNFLDPEELTHEFTPMGLAEFDSHWLTQFVECSDSILAARIWLEGTQSKDFASFRHSIEIGRAHV